MELIYQSTPWADGFEPDCTLNLSLISYAYCSQRVSIWWWYGAAFGKRNVNCQCHSRAVLLDACKNRATRRRQHGMNILLLTCFVNTILSCACLMTVADLASDYNNFLSYWGYGRALNFIPSLAGSRLGALFGGSAFVCGFGQGAWSRLSNADPQPFIIFPEASLNGSEDYNEPEASQHSS
jgi:hypothetical protein